MTKTMEVVIISQGKIHLERVDSDRIRASFFFGPDKDHLQKSGELILSVGDWQTLGAAMGLGLEQMVQVVYRDGKCYVPMSLIIEKQMKALGRENELEGKPDVSETPYIYQKKDEGDGKPDPR